MCEYNFCKQTLDKCNTSVLLYKYNNLLKNMRQVLSLSLPEETTKELKESAKRRGFESISAYVKYLFYLDKDLISETELLNSVKSARKEYKEGKAIKENL